MKVSTACLIGVAVCVSIPFGCAAPKQTEAQTERMDDRVQVAVEEFTSRDESMQAWFDDSYGYALFPTVGKGAVGVGGAHGEGLVYEQGEIIGTTALTQATIGFQLGGQAYREVIFFENKAALDTFTSGNFEFAAQASAVAATAGASADATFTDGMAIFTIQEGGLMYEASVGGQKFSFRPIGG